jgi:hypothetical protein
MLEDDIVTFGTYPGGHEAGLARDDRRRHLYLIGKTGTGKSTLLLNLMRADLAAGVGLALLDPHGDLAVALAQSAPRSRTSDILYLDPADATHAVGYNPVAAVPPEQRPLAAARIVAAFAHIWGESWGPRLEYILSNAIRLLLDAPDATLLGLPRLLVDAGYRERLLRTCRDPVIRAFWERELPGWSERLLSEAVSPVQNKVGTLLGSPVIRRMLGQKRSTLDLARIMDGGRVLIVNLAKGRIGEAPAHLLGALLTTAFAQAAEGRAATPEAERRDFTLYADEFQSFATASFATILSEARKWRLSLVLAHQFLGQVPPLLRQAVLGNAGSMISFRIGAEDVALIADELGLASKQALSELPSFRAWARLMRDGLPSEPRIIDLWPAADLEPGRLAVIRNRSRARHARPIAEVDAAIARFLQG